jgi:hypothetical protein
VSAPEPIVVAGSSPLVLVAPHGGQRDYVRRPWGSTPLKVNDLHTASLTEELAAVTDASAVINTGLDRNDVDLNRVSAAHDRARPFLERLAGVLSTTIARHGRATVLTVHGWNVIQPAVDLGFGCAHGAAVDRTAAVSPAFAGSAIPALVLACAAHGITATTGARYPARARENLVQLFTPRYRGDPRPLVRRLAMLGEHADALQLELAVPLRWPGAWRRGLVDACREALPALVDGSGSAGTRAVPAFPSPPATPVRRTLEIVGRGVSTLVALDQVGARLLLFPPGGGLALFTGERTGGEERGRVAGLRVDDGDDGTLGIRFAGPMMRFPDTTPFLDLERGLAGATVVEQAEVALDFEPVHAGADGSDFGGVRGAAVLDGERLDLGGSGFAGAGGLGTVWPRLRVALEIARGARLSLTVALPDGGASGFLCREGRHEVVARARARLGTGDDPLLGLAVDVELAGGDRFHVRPQAVHRLPVVRGGAPTPVRLVYAACRVAEVSGLAGWCELAGI